VSRPGSKLFLQLIKYINVVSKKLDSDPDTNNLLKLVFLPNFNNTKEYLYVPALDMNEQMTLPGKQACATQVLKYVMNGSILVGSRDATNLRIEKCLGKDVCLLFGKTYFEQATSTPSKSVALQSIIDSIVH
jgi:glycogen phosphorylase